MKSEHQKTEKRSLKEHLKEEMAVLLGPDTAE